MARKFLNLRGSKSARRGGIMSMTNRDKAKLYNRSETPPSLVGLDFSNENNSQYIPLIGGV